MLESQMSRELRKSMEENEEWLEEIDSIVQEALPDVFGRYFEANADEKDALEVKYKTPGDARGLTVLSTGEISCSQSFVQKRSIKRVVHLQAKRAAERLWSLR